jgi:hypothetical protein
MKIFLVLLFLLLPSYQKQLVEKSNADKFAMKCFEYGYKLGAQNVLIYNHYNNDIWIIDSLDMTLILQAK